MSTTILAPIALCVLGIVFGAILAVAAKVFAVENTVYRQRKNRNEKNGIHDHFFLTLHGVSTSFVPISCHTRPQDACVPRSATSLLPEALRQSHLQSHAALSSV